MVRKFNKLFSFYFLVNLILYLSAKISLKQYLTWVLLCFVAVFHVTDQNGNKLTDESVISYIEKVIIVDIILTIINFVLGLKTQFQNCN